jgi:octaprenyl-diphosphate synthase
VATLVHDDVIDHAPSRRGTVTVAKKFGMAAAILAGDWLHARSMELIGALTGAGGLAVFCRATASMVNGEFAQLRCVADSNTTEAQYFAVIRQKTGNLIASTCAIGALYAGAGPEQTQALTCYGDHIGAAFQVVDDLLDYQGQSGITGKATGNDFIEGKITLPLLHAIARADERDRHTIEELLNGDRTQPESYLQLQRIIEQYQGFTTAAQTARDLVEKAVAALAPFVTGGNAPPEITVFRELAGYILARQK